MAHVVDENGVLCTCPQSACPRSKYSHIVIHAHHSPSHNEASQNGKTGRRCKFNHDENSVIVQEVFASEAHIAPHGETASRFDAETQNCLANPNFTREVTGKCVQDRFKKLLEDFEKREKDDHNRSGTGGEIGKIDKLLGEMSQARKDVDTAKNRSSAERTDQEEKKIAAGQVMILN